MIIKKYTKGAGYKLSAELIQKDKIDSSSLDTKNPFDSLKFTDVEKKVSSTSYNFWLILVVAVLLFSSIALNQFFVEKLDPQILSCVSAIKEFTVGYINKPYVLTIGEYGNLAIAKEEALKLVPQLKQVDIKKLESGIYTFQIERFASKEKAYLWRDKYAKDGFNEVHVRCLLNQ